MSDDSASDDAPAQPQRRPAPENPPVPPARLVKENSGSEGEKFTKHHGGNTRDGD